MCGLIGGTGQIETRRMVALGCLSEDRGNDSAGVAWQVGDNLRVAKVAQNPLVAFPVTLAPAIRHAARYRVPLIGHTRQATTGAVNDKNAHPFFDTEANIAWAHNGIISNYLTFGQYEVDSEALIHGIKRRDFSDFFGPIALLWLENGKLHAFRKGNPLYRGTRTDAVYLASEEDMLKEIGCRRIKEISEGHIYVWEKDKLVSTKAVAHNKTYLSSGYSHFQGDEWGGYQGGRFGPRGTCGFRFTQSHNFRKPFEKKEEIPTVIEPPLTYEKPDNEGSTVIEPDTLAEADAQAASAERVGERGELTIADAELLCMWCRKNRRLAPGYHLCTGCSDNCLLENFGH